jgi:hypothetical protein
LDWGVHCLGCEVDFLLGSLQAIPEQTARDSDPTVLPYSAVLASPAVLSSPNENWAVFLTIGVDADARRISQALTEPEYLEVWITMPDLVLLSGHVEGSQTVATKTADGYRLDQYRAGRVVASFVGSFLFCHQRKMRLSWRNVARPDVEESLVDFRIRGNFGGCILELRHMVLQSAGDFLWHHQLWSASLARLATILRSA